MEKYKNFIFISAVLLATGIGLGAIGAHALESNTLITHKNLESWKTGVMYQLIQGVGMLLVIAIGYFLQLNKLESLLRIMTIGTLLFSMSIYLLVLNSIWQLDALKYAMVALTPIGGMMMILGWLVFAYRLTKK
jgi:uncharacterized membrane protein YgdD (TMEM256/DUF423 family)